MTSTLDAELDRIGWQGSGDFAKIDIEGWEPAAVLGARRWLDSGPDGLILEANGLDSRSPVLWDEAVRMLRDHDMDFTWPALPRTLYGSSRTPHRSRHSEILGSLATSSESPEGQGPPLQGRRGIPIESATVIESSCARSRSDAGAISA